MQAVLVYARVHVYACVSMHLHGVGCRRSEELKNLLILSFTCTICRYGSIGQACAKLARALKMHVVGFRRRAELSQQDKEEGLLVSTEHCS